jgi:Zn-dependent metalloprotease
LSIQKVSSAFEQGRGFVFPAGPKQSSLSEVIFTQLLGDGLLSKTSHKVTSQAPQQAQSANETFNYEPSDVRFDQVQTFYFVDQALHFFKQQLGVTIPFFIDVQTDVGSPEKTNAMFYYHGAVRLGSGDGISYTNIMKDPSIVTHETCHALIEALAHLPMGQGEGGSINEGFADFFATSFLGNPNLAEVAFIKGPYKRTVNNDMKLSEKNGGLYHDSLIVSGTFYEIKKQIGTKPSLDLAVKTLMRMGPSGNLGNFKQNVLFALDQGFTDEQKKTVSDVLAQKGW